MAATFKKYTGVSVNTDSKSGLPELKTSCRLELCTNMLLKGMQVGSVAGLTFYPALSAALYVQPNFPLERRSPSYYITAGFVLGGLIGPAIHHARTRNLTEAECCLRAYKIRTNSTTMWIDRACFVGAACGVGAAYFVGNRLLNGATVGFALGSLVGCVANATGYLS